VIRVFAFLCIPTIFIGFYHVDKLSDGATAERIRLVEMSSFSSREKNIVEPGRNSFDVHAMGFSMKPRKGKCAHERAR